jgi:autotransporter passenger strand-loop-strand repeat protein
MTKCSKGDGMNANNTSGFSALYEACRASGGSSALIATAVRQMAFASSGGPGGDAVNSGGVAVSSAHVAEVTRVVREVWQSSGGSRALFEEKLKRRLGLVDGGRKFLAALSLACVLQTTLAPIASAFTGDVGAGVTVHNEVVEGSEQRVHDGGVANSTTVNELGAQIVVYNGGVANHTTVNMDGEQIVDNGGVANHTTVNMGGEQNVDNGGVANHTTVNDGGAQRVYNGGIANDAVVNVGGYQYIDYGGIANSTTVYSGGRQAVASGGSSLDIAQHEGGRVDVDVIGSDTATSVTGTNLDTGTSFSLANGSASGFILYAGGSQTVSGGGIANSTMVYAGGRQTVSSGGS